MINETTIMEIWIVGIVLFIVIILIAIMFTYFSIKDKIHNTYHKGYNEHRNDKINYYEKLRELNNDFTFLIKQIKEKEIDFDINFIETLIDFGNKIRNFMNNN